MQNRALTGRYRWAEAFSKGRMLRAFSFLAGAELPFPGEGLPPVPVWGRGAIL